MSVLDHPHGRRKHRRAKSSGDNLGWVAGVMIAVGMALCLAALLNI